MNAPTRLDSSVQTLEDARVDARQAAHRYSRSGFGLPCEADPAERTAEALDERAAMDAAAAIITGIELDEEAASREPFEHGDGPRFEACDSESEQDSDAASEKIDELDVLTDRYAHRVRYFAHRVERRFGLAPLWRDDLVSAGYWGLLKALRNRRADAHEHELSAYVSRRVEGAVIDEARQILTRHSNQSQLDPCDLDEGAGGGEASADEWSRAHAPESPEVHADRMARWRMVEETFDRLDDGHGQLLIAYASGRSLAELARQDGASPARLQSRMTRIARQVRARAPELRRILRYEI